MKSAAPETVSKSEVSTKTSSNQLDLVVLALAANNEDDVTFLLGK